MNIYLYNSLSRTKEAFTPLEDNLVKMYHCGPTVYDYAHIGNFRSYIFADILRRTMEYTGFDVRQVMNITDVGHLVSDADEGEDKMSAALKREGKELTLENMRALADFYTEQFKKDMAALNIKEPQAMPRASDYIDAQIALVKQLEERGAAYQTSDGVYFDTSTFSSYGVLGGSANEEYSRTGVSAEKRNPRDFALWKFSDSIGWKSPWGTGFPGWHIECSAMAVNELGEQFDIHTGGIDLKPIHHNNEIAQSETATGKPLANYWMHSEFVTVDGKKMSKSAGNFITLRDIIEEKGFSPRAFRYLALQTHYRTPLNFTWEALEAAENALERLHEIIVDSPDEGGVVNTRHKAQFEDALADDLNTPKALAALWELAKDADIPPEDKRATLLDFDRVLGLGLASVEKEEVPYEIVELVNKRAEARAREDWQEADRLRDEIRAQGFEVRDTEAGIKLRKL